MPVSGSFSEVYVGIPLFEKVDARLIVGLVGGYIGDTVTVEPVCDLPRWRIGGDGGGEGGAP